jgi:hypothetical protein
MLTSTAAYLMPCNMMLLGEQAKQFKHNIENMNISKVSSLLQETDYFCTCKSTEVTAQMKGFHNQS